MDTDTFDRLAKTLGSGASRRGVFAALVSLAGLDLARGAAAAKDHKVTICHRTESAEQPFRAITVAESAIPAHEAHGDLVSCGANEELDLEACVCRPRGGAAVGCNPPDCPNGQTCQARPIPPSNAVANVCCQYAQTDQGCGQLSGEPVAARFTCTETCAGGAGSRTRNDLVPCGAQSHCPVGPGTCGTGFTCLPSRCCGFNVCVPVCDGSRV
jgi:hypothetical protein